MDQSEAISTGLTEAMSIDSKSHAEHAPPRRSDQQVWSNPTGTSTHFSWSSRTSIADRVNQVNEVKESSDDSLLSNQLGGLSMKAHTSGTPAQTAEAPATGQQQEKTPWDEEFIKEEMKNGILKGGLDPGVLKIETVEEAKRVNAQLVDLARREPHRIFACDTEVSTSLDLLGIHHTVCASFPTEFED